MQGHPAETNYSAQDNEVGQGQKPLVSDIDGTLITTDLLQDAFLQKLRTHPLCAAKTLTSLIKGRAAFKACLAREVDIDPSDLPWNRAVVDFLRKAHDDGRPIWLASAAHQSYADNIARYLGFIDRVFASSDSDNCKGERKRELIESFAGNKGYDYIGDSRADRPLFQGSNQAWVTGPRAEELIGDLKANGHDADQLGGQRKRSYPRTIFHLLRPHHWLKNILVFLPLIAGHAWFNPPALTGAVLTFIAFCLIASAGYIFNDLLDLPFDRRHPRKCLRPIAACELDSFHAVALFTVIMALGLLTSWGVGWSILGFVAGYFVLTTSYSLILKSKPLIDVLTLALLYNVRILAGSFAAGLALSYWLIAFTLFLFFGLAVMKRTNELLDIEGSGTLGRGYQPEDKQVLVPLGIASSVASAVVLSLYMNSSKVMELYSNPEWLWLAIPVVLLWQCGLWIATVRGVMHDDPLVYAVQYSGSYWAATGLILFFIMSM